MFFLLKQRKNPCLLNRIIGAQRRTGKSRNRRSLSALSGRASTTTLLVMVDRMKGEGFESGHCQSVCTLSSENRGMPCGSYFLLGAKKNDNKKAMASTIYSLCVSWLNCTLYSTLLGKGRFEIICRLESYPWIFSFLFSKLNSPACLPGTNYSFLRFSLKT
jgi:hypothetical protein